MRTVLHVLPHPGGGGETYVDSLERMSGYRHTRFFLAPSRKPLSAATSLVSSVPRANFVSRRFDILHVHGEVSAFLCLPALARAPSVVTLHGLNLVRRSEGASGLLASSNLKLVVGAASKTICVSAAERDEVVETIGARMAGKLVVVPNGVPLAPGSSIDARNSIRAELGVEDSVVVLSVGALDPPKDPLALARAAVSVARSGSKVVLLVVGDGGLRAEAEAIARESSGVIRVLGRRDDVAHLLTAADVFVLWSRHEGLPYALLEAMAAGLPAVVSDYPGAREVVGDAGLLVPHEKADGFAEAIRRLAADPGIRAELGGRARRRIEDRFSLEKMLDATRRVYGEVLGDPHGGG